MNRGHQCEPQSLCQRIVCVPGGHHDRCVSRALSIPFVIDDVVDPLAPRAPRASVHRASVEKLTCERCHARERRSPEKQIGLNNWHDAGGLRTIEQHLHGAASRRPQID